MVKPKPTKKETRQEIANQIDAFLKSKGEIQHADMGESGLVDGKYNTSHIGFGEPRQERTPLTHVVAEMQKRKAGPKANTLVQKRRKKVIVYDDFGDPIRWHWEEE